MVLKTRLGRSRIGYRISISLSGLRSDGAFSRLGLRTRDQFQWVQIASDELPLSLSSASDRNWTGFK